jgi:hypothetical protein
MYQKLNKLTTLFTTEGKYFGLLSQIRKNCLILKINSKEKIIIKKKILDSFQI